MNNFFAWLQQRQERLITAFVLLLSIISLIGYKIYKKVNQGNTGNKPIGTAPEGLKYVANKYGVEFARKIEQALRHETAHFKSGQWLQCGSAGMETSHKIVNGKRVNNDVYPYGWGLVKWINEEKNGLTEKDFATVQMKDAHTGAVTLYIKWKRTGDFVRFFAWHIQNVRGGRIGYWNSLNEQKASHYESLISKIQTHYV